MLKKGKRKLAIGLAAMALLCCAAAAAAVWSGKDKTEYQTNAVLMDTYVSIRTWGRQPDGYIELVKLLDAELDPFDPGSCLYKLNREGSASSEVLSDITVKALSICKDEQAVDITCGKLVELWNTAAQRAKLPEDAELSDALKTVGLQNVSVSGDEITLKGGTFLNFGCCAKGYACDALAEKMKEDKVSCAVVSFGSSTMLLGRKPDGSKFKTAVTDPFDTSKAVCVISTGEAFISTSGGYERYAEIGGKSYGHIFDLRSGYPAETDLRSVTVICQSGIQSDLLSTAIYIGGTDSLDSYLSRNDIEVLAIDRDKNIYASPQLVPKIGSVAEGYKLTTQLTTQLKTQR